MSLSFCSDFELIQKPACPVLSALRRTRGRSCMASLKTKREDHMLKQRARLASAAAPGPTGHNSAAHPAAAPSAEAAPAAAQTHAQSQVTQDSTPVFQTSRASGDAAVTPARSARQHATPLVQSRAKRACVTSAAARRPRSRAAADDVDDTSGSTSASSYAPSTADGAPEPGSDAGDGPRAGGASHVATARGCWLSGHGGRELWAVASAA